MTLTSPSANHHRLIILGSGPAGYTAAIYAARAMLNPVLITGAEPGGQLTITTDVENYPGFAKPIQGPWLMEEMRAQAEHVGTTLISDHIESVDLSRRPFTLQGDSGTTYSCDCLIIATGAKARWLGLPTEAKFQGFGVSACATCDGFFYRGKDVVVVGGGNSAVEEALYLCKIARHVTLVHRRDTLRAERILQERLKAQDNVSFIWDSSLIEFCGTDNPTSLTHVRLENHKTGVVSALQTHGVFVAIGHAPASSLFKGQIALHDNGYIAVNPGTTNTTIDGVFAAGDVADSIYRQAVTAAGMGCMAALDAERWLASIGAHHASASTPHLTAAQ